MTFFSPILYWVWIFSFSRKKWWWCNLKVYNLSPIVEVYRIRAIRSLDSDPKIHKYWSNRPPSQIEPRLILSYLNPDNRCLWNHLVFDYFSEIITIFFFIHFQNIYKKFKLKLKVVFVSNPIPHYTILLAERFWNM